MWAYGQPSTLASCLSQRTGFEIESGGDTVEVDAVSEHQVLAERIELRTKARYKFKNREGGKALFISAY